MLRLCRVSAAYGRLRALSEVDLTVGRGELVALLGANGAGKSTLIQLISGLLRPAAGEVSFRGRSIAGLPPERIVDLGISQVPEGRLVFAPLSVRDNLELGAFRRRREGRAAMDADLQRILTLFPPLAARLAQRAGTLSGGEQQMLAIGRALMARPTLLLLDEPSLGLAPLVVQEIMAVIGRLRAEGTTVLLVEQNARAALSICDRAYVLQGGRVLLQGSGAELLASQRVCHAYLGTAVPGAPPTTTIPSHEGA
jgi:branched-chain amino acid transport system ATP-binding protein